MKGRPTHMIHACTSHNVSLLQKAANWIQKPVTSVCRVRHAFPALHLCSLLFKGAPLSLSGHRNPEDGLIMYHMITKPKPYIYSILISYRSHNYIILFKYGFLINIHCKYTVRHKETPNHIPPNAWTQRKQLWAPAPTYIGTPIAHASTTSTYSTSPGPTYQQSSNSNSAN